MKKEELIAKLEGAKEVTSVVSIDLVLAALGMLEPEVRVEKVFGMSQELADQLEDKISRALDYNSDACIDKDSASFEINYNNQVELTEVNLDVYEIMRHVTGVFEEFIIEEDELEEEVIEAQPEAAEEGVLRDIDEDDSEAEVEESEDRSNPDWR